ncbi:hypothetical protein AVEN_249644-1 [Araneus ventricosus]|uniref:Uncharacterized protein n=1 Tax=Araneus ventricosus TaxID=182803 RepID=A0A4Y2M1K9_ARAVE|nr:hypothetical protein AVEN_249644-1 [Araneus ventricosus]
MLNNSIRYRSREVTLSDCLRLEYSVSQSLSPVVTSLASRNTYTSAWNNIKAYAFSKNGQHFVSTNFDSFRYNARCCYLFAVKEEFISGNGLLIFNELTFLTLGFLVRVFGDRMPSECDLRSILLSRGVLFLLLFLDS